MKALLSLMLIVPALFAGKWEKQLSKDGITIWTRSVEGSDIKEARGQALMPVTTMKLWKGMEDQEKLSKVVPDVTKSEQIGTCGERCVYVYEVMHHPPLKDRHYVIKVQWTTEETDRGTKIRQWWAKAKDKKPPGGGMEMVDLYGSYDFVPSDDGLKTKFTYTYFVDPGGVAVAFFVNMNLPDGTFKILKDLRKECVKW